MHTRRITWTGKHFDSDVLIIGAGVIGCMAARELSRYKLDVTVLERNSDVCEGSSKSNSGLIHAGFHPRGGSLKGTGCVEGNAMYERICAELEVPLKRTGSLYVAFGPNGEERIRSKYKNGIQNGVPDMRIIALPVAGCYLGAVGAHRSDHISVQAGRRSVRVGAEKRCPL